MKRIALSAIFVGSFLLCSVAAPSPSSGPVKIFNVTEHIGSNSITLEIQGQNFTDGHEVPQVEFDGEVPVTVIDNLLTSEFIAVVMPLVAPGDYRVVVTNQQGSSGEYDLAIDATEEQDLLTGKIFMDGFEAETVCQCSPAEPGLCDRVFVSKRGHDVNDGSVGSPKLTIQAGIDAAVVTDKSAVCVSYGRYQERLQLAANVSVLGGFSADYSARNTHLHEVIVAPSSLGASPDSPGAVNAIGINSGDPGTTTFSGFTILASSGFESGQFSSYGIYLRDVDASVRITNNIVLASAGMHGSRGSDGSDGRSGIPGSVGVNALDLYATFGVTGHDCAAENHSAGGAGGQLTCPDYVVDGGNGGQRVCPGYDGIDLGTVPPVASENGVDSAGRAAGGAAGRDVFHQAFSCDGYQNFPGLLEGQDGSAGLPGDDGSAGWSDTFFGIVTNGLWQPVYSASGGLGNSGIGGGGGGSGAGAYTHDSCDAKGFNWDNLGGTGGGGGSGGCYGNGGQGGGSGGGSFAVFLTYYAAPVEVPDILANTLFTGAGGFGGDGGHGGVAGEGGTGGEGGSSITWNGNPDPVYPSFSGGNGGDGGRGGHGGGGAGGNGGPSYGLYVHGLGTPPPAQWSDENTVVLTGFGGMGGRGGYSFGNPGEDGLPGPSSAFNF